jgi:hypothetical protein
MIKIETDIRVPTGCIKFGKDWAGVFIRGDDAIGFVDNIRRCQEGIQNGTLRPDQRNGPLETLLNLLASCIMSEVKGG